MDELGWAAEKFDALDYTPLGAFVLRKDFTVLFWNRLLENWTNILRDHIVGQSIMAHFPRLAEPRYAIRLEHIFAGGPPTIFSAQLHNHIIRTRRLRIQHTTVAAVPGPMDGEFYALFSLEDVTELTQRSQAYRRLRDQALAEIVEREQAEAEREQLIAELEAFAHTVAHGLKNPLGKIVGYAGLLVEDASLLKSDEAVKCLQIISKSGLKMRSIIEALLMLSNVRAMGDAPMGPLDMAAIVAEVQERQALHISDYGATLVMPESWPAAKGYAPWVEEVWANYISNAVKYGGAEDTMPLVALGAEVEPGGEMVRCWVRDNGPGIAPEDQQRLFTPFTRLSNTEQIEGHGLGLSIVQRIIERLGGEVAVESEAGQGSTFSFTLPRA